MPPRLATFSRRMTSTLEASMLVGVGEQCQVARTLYGERELALVMRLGARDTTRHDLAGLGHVALQRRQVLVVDPLHALGGEATEFLAAEESRHGASSNSCVSADQRAASRGRSSSSSRSPPSGPSSRGPRPSVSSAARAIGEGSVIALSSLITR